MKRSGCIDPKLGETLLEAMAGDSASSDLARHLDRCPACRASVERTRRIAVTWHASEPTHAELASARVRFAMGATTGRQPRVAPGIVAAAIVLTGAAAFASTRVMAFRAARLAVASAAHDAPQVASNRQAVKPRRAVPSKDKDTATPAPASSDTVVAVEDLPLAPVSAPPVAPQAPPAQSRTAVPEAPSAVPAPAAKPGSAWIDAAAALRAGDYARAEEMFGELANAPDARTRDEARLARAQVWLAQGRRSEAQPELEALAVSGSTPLVRQRAAQAISALP
jgi:hypothetical protein